MEDRSLQLDNVSMEDMGEYSCEADNAVGTVTATGTLFVHCKYFIWSVILRHINHFLNISLVQLNLNK